MQQYKGALTAEQIAAGMNAARRNAKRLADDAKGLLKTESYPSAASLAALSIEESGMVSILRQLAMAPDQEIRRQAWKDYRSHRSKNTMWILPQLVSDGARHLDDLRAATDHTEEHAALLDHVKQLAFFTDCLGKAHWSEPSHVIDKELAQTLVTIVDQFATTETISIKEIELWIEHMQPVYGSPLDRMKTALETWFAAMRQHGLRVEDNSTVQDFIRGPRN